MSSKIYLCLALFTGSQTHSHTHTHTPATVRNTLTLRRVGTEVMHRRSRDRLPSAAGDDHAQRVERMCTCIRKYDRNDFEDVLFLHATVNLNLMELCKSCCYRIKVSVLEWSHNGFHDCSVTKLSKLLSDVPFHGGATLAVYIDCQQALPKLRNSIITRF